MVDIHLVVVLAVEFHATDIAVLSRQVVGFDGEFAVGQRDLGFFKCRGSEPVAAAGRFYLVETEV